VERAEKIVFIKSTIIICSRCLKVCENSWFLTDSDRPRYAVRFVDADSENMTSHFITDDLICY